MSAIDITAARELIARSKTTELDEEALTLAHLAVEDVLIEFRDERISVMGPANGFVVKERDGSGSAVMRLGTRAGLEIGIKAYLAAAARAEAE